MILAEIKGWRYNFATMSNSPETSIPTRISREEIPASLDLKMKLRNLMPNLTPRNALFVEGILNIEEGIAPPGEYLDLLTSIIDLIGNNPDRTKRLTEERRSAERVDMMELMAPFNAAERRRIARNLHTIQMTDGCTVGCPWCGAEAKRKVDKAFSFDSFTEFMRRYGKLLPQRVYLFGDSDPFDWISEDGRNDYLHLADLFLENAKNRYLYTSTAVPQGSELAVFRLLLFYHQRVMEKLENDQEIDMGFRFSQTKNNRGRIDKIMQALRNFGVSDEFLRRMIEIVDRDPDEDNGVKGDIKNVGYFIKHQNADERIRDMVTIFTRDGLAFSPPSIKRISRQAIMIGGIGSESLEAVTPENSVGLRRIKIVPGQLEIPNRLWVHDYAWALGRKGNTFFKMLPKHSYHVYREGKLVGVKVVESVRRDALSFALAISNLQVLSDLFLSPEVRERRMPKRKIRFIIRAIREKFVPEFEGRRQSCLQLFPEEPDEQAKRVALSLIGKIEKWLANIDTHLGINTKDFYNPDVGT